VTGEAAPDLTDEAQPEPLSRWLKTFYLRKVGFTPIFLVLLSMPWFTTTHVGCGGAQGPQTVKTGWQATGGSPLVPLATLCLLSLLACWARRPRALRALTLLISLGCWGGLALSIWLISMYYRAEIEWKTWLLCLSVLPLPMVLLLDLLTQLHLRRRPPGPATEWWHLRLIATGVGLVGTWIWLIEGDMVYGVWIMLSAYFLLESCIYCVCQTALGHRLLFTFQTFILTLVFLQAAVVLMPGAILFTRIDETHTGYELAVLFVVLYSIAPLIEFVVLLREWRRA